MPKITPVVAGAGVTPAAVVVQVVAGAGAARPSR